MASPVEFAKAGAELNRKALVPMFVALLLGMIVAGLPQAILGGVVPVLLPAGAALTSLLQGLIFVAYIHMAIRLRKGEQVAIGDIFKFQDFLVPALLINAPIAALQLLGFLGMVVPALALVMGLVATLASLALFWAPYEMATRKNLDFKACWMASIEVWKGNPVGTLVFLILGGIMCLIYGWLIFAGGAFVCAATMYYTDRRGQQAFQPGAAAVAPMTAGAAK